MVKEQNRKPRKGDVVEHCEGGLYWCKGWKVEKETGKHLMIYENVVTQNLRFLPKTEYPGTELMNGDPVPAYRVLQCRL